MEAVACATSTLPGSSAAAFASRASHCCSASGSMLGEGACVSAQPPGTSAGWDAPQVAHVDLRNAREGAGNLRADFPLLFSSLWRRGSRVGQQSQAAAQWRDVPCLPALTATFAGLRPAGGKPGRLTAWIMSRSRRAMPLSKHCTASPPCRSWARYRYFAGPSSGAAWMLFSKRCRMDARAPGARVKGTGGRGSVPAAERGWRAARDGPRRARGRISRQHAQNRPSPAGGRRSRS